jgi:hypothetical protein
MTRLHFMKSIRWGIACFWLASARTGRAQLERDSIRPITGIRIDGDLADWAGRPFIVLGAATPSERELNAISQWGWTNEGLYLAERVHVEADHPGPPAAGADTIDLFVDTRPRDAPMDAYEHGVFHFVITIPPDGGPSGLRLVDARLRPIVCAFPAELSVVSRREPDGWTLEAYFPWQAMGGFRPRVGGWLGTAVRITHRAAASGRSWTVGDITVDPNNPLETTPLAFSSVKLLPEAAALQPLSWRAEEIVLQGEPWLEIEAVAVRPNPGAKLPALHLQVSSLKLEAEIPFVISPSGRYQIARDSFPLAKPSLADDTVIVRLSGAGLRSEIETPVAIRVAREFSRIDHELPDAVVARLGKDEQGLVNVFKACAKETATLLSSSPDGVMAPQRRFRSSLHPDIYEHKIGVYLAHAREFLQGRRMPATYFFRGWRSEVDGSWLPIRVLFPLNYAPGRTYPAKVVAEGLVRDRNLTRVMDKVLRQYDDDTLAETEGEGFTFFLYGRGNSYSRLGDEEINYVCGPLAATLPIDPRRISIYGSSTGAVDAVILALRTPDRFAWIHARAGPFGAVRDYAEEAVTDAFFENLAHAGVFLEAGANDRLVAASNRWLIAKLNRLQIPSAYEERPGEGHFFEPGPVPPEIASILLPRHPREVSFVTTSIDYHSSFWLSIDRIARAPLPARVAGKLDALGHVEVTTQNVAALSIDFRELVDGPESLSLRLDGIPQSDVPRPHEEGPMHYIRVGGRWHPATGPLPFGKSPGLCGPASRIETAPLMIVYGTLDPVLAPWLRRRALDVIRARIGTAVEGQDGAGHFALKADREVVAADLAHFNLWLIGGPAENAVTASMATWLPGQTMAGGVRLGSHVFTGRSLLLSYIYPNFENRHHYLYVEEGTDSVAYLGTVLAKPSEDFSVESLDEGRASLIEAGSFDSDWKVPPTSATHAKD